MNGVKDTTIIDTRVTDNVVNSSQNTPATSLTTGVENTMPQTGVIDHTQLVLSCGLSVLCILLLLTKVLTNRLVN